MSLTVKAYLDKGKDKLEIRRFAVDQSVSASLAYLTGKISQVFPSLKDKSYDLYWKGKQQRLIHVNHSSPDFLMNYNADHKQQGIDKFPKEQASSQRLKSCQSFIQFHSCSYINLFLFFL